ANDNDGSFWFRVRLADNALDRGLALAEVGLWKEGAAAFARGDPQFSDWHFTSYCSALVHLEAGNVAAYRRLATTMLERYGVESPSGDLLRTCTVSPQGAADTARLLNMAEKLHQANPKANWYVMNLGMAHYRAGQFEPARRYIKQALALGDWAVFWPALAMTY